MFLKCTKKYGGEKEKRFKWKQISRYGAYILLKTGLKLIPKCKFKIYISYFKFICASVTSQFSSNLHQSSSVKSLSNLQAMYAVSTLPFPLLYSFSKCAPKRSTQNIKIYFCASKTAFKYSHYSLQSCRIKDEFVIYLFYGMHTNVMST